MANNRPFLDRTIDQIKRFADLPMATTRFTEAELLEDIRTAHSSIYEEIAKSIGPEDEMFRTIAKVSLLENQEFEVLPSTYRRFKSFMRWDTDHRIVLHRRPQAHRVDEYGVFFQSHTLRMRFSPKILGSEVGEWELEYDSGPVELHYGAPVAHLSLTNATFINATKTLSHADLAGYTFKTNDIIRITGGTGVTVGRYKIVSKPTGTSVVLDQDIGGANPVDVGGSIFKSDRVTLAATKGQLYTTSGYYSGAVLYVVSGGGMGQFASVNSYTAGVALLEAGQEWTEPPDDQSVYEVRPWLPGLPGQFDELVAWRASLKYRRIKSDDGSAEASAIREIKHLLGNALSNTHDRSTESGKRFGGPRIHRHRAIWG